MGLFCKALRRRRHQVNPEVDLLSAAFGLPFRRGVMPAGFESSRRLEAAYKPDPNALEESDSEETSSSSSEKEVGHSQCSRRASDRPPTPHHEPLPSPSSSKKNSPRKRHQGQHRLRPSPHTSPRMPPRHRVPRSASRRSNIGNMANQHAVPYVQHSATFPQIPVHLSNPPYNIVQSSNFSIPSLNPSFGAPICQPLHLPQQQMYYQNPISYVPHQPSPLVRVHPRQFIPPMTQVSTRPSHPGLAKVPVSPALSSDAQLPPKEVDVCNPMASASKSPDSSEVFGKDVQFLQKLIEAKMADLAEEPNSRVLRRDLRHLQDRLNSTLNKAITASKKPRERQPSLSTFSNFSQAVSDKQRTSNNSVESAASEQVFINYCAVCILELKGNKYRKKGAQRVVENAHGSEGDLDSLTVNRHRNHKEEHSKARNDQGLEVSPSKQAPTDEKPRGRRPEPRASRESIAASSTGIVSPHSSFCPSRSTGSSERRAERKSSGHFSTERSAHKDEPKMPLNYQAPYVEDSFSTPHLEVHLSSPVTVHKESAKKMGTKACEPRKTLPPDFVLKSALASDRSSSDGSRNSRDEALRESPRPREKSLESDRSDPSSSKSSGSKTVRFKQSVDIRTTLPFDGDSEASDSDTPACLRSPGSPLISRKKSNLRKESRDGAFSDKYIYPHHGQSSDRSPGGYREYLHTTDSFGAGDTAKGYFKGAFSKDFDHSDDRDAVRSPQYSHVENYSDDSLLRGCNEADEEFHTPTPRAYDYGHHAHYMESTASLPSRLSSGSIFSSFFKKSKNKTTSFPAANRASSYPPDHNFNETTRDN
ncbi:hypothetical protein FGRMN_2581 [Fusarium graminum]|nr:hypothetical protein FGRMN_2581 [Fusarium graminum]